VQEETVTFIDSTRDTPARGDVPGHHGRVLVTTVLRPVTLAGPFPLVVFAHGWNSDPQVYRPLLTAWAQAGYLVAAPTFPDSADTLPGTPVSNYGAQAQDMTFLISSLLSGAAGPVDKTRIAVAGHSDGGADVALMALNPHYTDARVRAYLSLSGQIPMDVSSGPWGVPLPGALLVAVGTADQYGLLDRAEQIFQTAQMPKVLLTVTAGDHLTTFIGDTAAQAAMRAETVRFLNTVFSVPTITTAALQAALTPTGDPAIVLQTNTG
jgi:pimeloyl-ACP methyl ester carboxylesterase